MATFLPIFASDDPAGGGDRVVGIWVAISFAFAAGLPATFATAQAADATVPPPQLKAPWQPPVVQPYDWTGLYVGGHLGYAWGRSNWSTPPDLASSLDLNQPSDIFTGSGSYFRGLQPPYNSILPTPSVLAPHPTTPL